MMMKIPGRSNKDMTGFIRASFRLLNLEAPLQSGASIKGARKRLEAFHGVAKNKQHKSDQNQPECKGGQESDKTEFCDQANSSDYN